MTDVRVVKWGLFWAIGVSGCVGARPDLQHDLAFLSANPARQESIAAMIGDMPTDGDDIVRRHLVSGPESSVFLIRIPGGEEPHRHTRYDLTVMVVEGEGTLWLDGEPLSMRRGDIAHIPKDVPHHFINTGAGPATALGVFSPKFTGPDSAPIR
jgi:quercetin dioxygenase-like cupin family protein